MKYRSTVLSPVQKGNMWRVQITWPNGTVHYFGKFASEKDTIEWIAARPWLTKPAPENSTSEP
jgi:hypothetical protein